MKDCCYLCSVRTRRSPGRNTRFSVRVWPQFPLKAFRCVNFWLLTRPYLFASLFGLGAYSLTCRAWSLLLCLFMFAVCFFPLLSLSPSLPSITYSFLSPELCSGIWRWIVLWGTPTVGGRGEHVYGSWSGCTASSSMITEEAVSYSFWRMMVQKAS